MAVFYVQVQNALAGETKGADLKVGPYDPVPYDQ
jgi:hypothetical protein